MHAGRVQAAADIIRSGKHANQPVRLTIGRCPPLGVPTAVNGGRTAAQRTAQAIMAYKRSSNWRCHACSFASCAGELGIRGL